MPNRNDNRGGRKSQSSSRQRDNRSGGSRQHEQSSDRGSSRQQGEMDRDDEGRFSSNR